MTAEEKASAVDPLLWIRPEAQEKWVPFVSDEVKAFWHERALTEAAEEAQIKQYQSCRKPNQHGKGGR
jgi:hypothetical protein